MKSLILPILCLTLLNSCNNVPPKICIVPYVEIPQDSFYIYKNMLDYDQDTLRQLHRELKRKVHPRPRP
jgi:hypothetical protein